MSRLVRIVLLTLMIAILVPSHGQAGPFSQFFKGWFKGWGTSSAKRAAPGVVRKHREDNATFRDAGEFVLEQAAQNQLTDAAKDRYQDNRRFNRRGLRRKGLRRSVSP